MIKFEEKWYFCDFIRFDPSKTQILLEKSIKLSLYLFIVWDFPHSIRGHSMTGTQTESEKRSDPGP